MSVVAVTKFGETSAEEYEKALRKQIEALGGWSKFEKLVKDKFVCLKVNWNTPDVANEGVTTNPNFVRAAARVVNQAGAKEVVLGESGGFGPYDVNFYITGTKDAVSDLAFLKLGDFNNEKLTEVTVPNAISNKKYIQPETLRKAADKRTGAYIGLALMKTHMIGRVTLGMKLHIGDCPSSYYAHDYKAPWATFQVGTSPYSGNFAKNDMHLAALKGWQKIHGKLPIMLPELNLDLHGWCADLCTKGVNYPDLTFVDASIGREGASPLVWKWSFRVDMKDRVGSFLLFGSYDVVALDTIGARVQGWQVEELQRKPGIMQLHYGEEKGIGLGPSNYDKIQVKGDLTKETLPHANFYRAPHFRNDDCPGSMLRPYWFEHEPCEKVSKILVSW